MPGVRTYQPHDPDDRPPDDGGYELTVRLTRSGIADTEDQTFWTLIRRTAEAIPFERYSESLDDFLAGRSQRERLQPRRSAVCVAIVIIAFLVGVLVGLVVG